MPLPIQRLGYEARSATGARGILLHLELCANADCNTQVLEDNMTLHRWKTQITFIVHRRFLFTQTIESRFLAETEGSRHVFQERCLRRLHTSAVQLVSSFSLSVGSFDYSKEWTTLGKPRMVPLFPGMERRGERIPMQHQPLRGHRRKRRPLYSESQNQAADIGKSQLL